MVFVSYVYLSKWLVLVESNTAEDVKHPVVSPTIFSSEPIRLYGSYFKLQRLQKLTPIKLFQNLCGSIIPND